MGSKIKHRQKNNERPNKGEKKRKVPSVVIESLQHYHGGFMRDRRMRRQHEREDYNDGWLFLSKNSSSPLLLAH